MRLLVLILKQSRYRNIIVSYATKRYWEDFKKKCEKEHGKITWTEFIYPPHHL